MRIAPKSLVIAASFVLLTIVPAAAAVQGVALNGSTGNPQAGVTINLVQPGANGMQQLDSTVSGQDGAFLMDTTPQGVSLLQSVYENVTYTQALPPGTPTTGLQVNVYEAVPVAPVDMATQHLILLEPTITELNVSQTFFIANPSQFTYQNPDGGSLRLYLPEGVSPDGLQVTVDSTGVPITRPLEPTSEAGLYAVDYPIKPGETRFDLTYKMPDSETFTIRVVTPPTRLVAVSGVTLAGEGLQELGIEPQTQARVYLSESSLVDVSITGLLASDDAGAPKCCEEVLPRIYTQTIQTPFGGIETMWFVLGFGVAILLLGGFLLFRKGSGPISKPAASVATSKSNKGIR